MKIFIWENLKGLTSNCHSTGGLLIIAKSIKDCKKLVQEKSQDGGKYGEFALEAKDLPKPDFSFNIEASKEKLLYFPDAGCC